MEIENLNLQPFWDEKCNKGKCLTLFCCKFDRVKEKSAASKKATVEGHSWRTNFHCYSPQNLKITLSCLSQAIYGQFKVKVQRDDVSSDHLKIILELSEVHTCKSPIENIQMILPMKYRIREHLCHCCKLASLTFCWLLSCSKKFASWPHLSRMYYSLLFHRNHDKHEPQHGQLDFCWIHLLIWFQPIYWGP